MKSDIYLDEFDRSEYSDAVQAMIGRLLIIATRFDAQCKSAALHIDLKNGILNCENYEEIGILIRNLENRDISLARSLKAMRFPKPASEILRLAREARNHVAHDLAKGMNGCLETKIDDAVFVSHVSELVKALTHGDLVISHTLSVLNGETSLTADCLPVYVDKVVRWVIEL